MSIPLPYSFTYHDNKYIFQTINSVALLPRVHLIIKNKNLKQRIKQMKFIIIFGPSAVGKMSVGQALADMTDMKLFHNHMSIEAVRPIFDAHRSPKHFTLVSFFDKGIQIITLFVQLRFLQNHLVR
jgi:hypothetical protein